MRHVLRAVRSQGVPESAAEDVAQEVFVAVHDALPRFDTSRPFMPWLMTIAYHKAIDYRRRAPVPANHVEIGEVDVEDNRGHGPERLTMFREARRVFDTIVARVDEPYRTVYLLAEVDELQVPEIAQVLAIPVGTAASRLKRGREAFEEQLAKAKRAEQRRTGAAMLPLFFTDPTAIHDAGRALPSITADAAARIWGKVTATITGAAAATAAGAAVATAARLVSLTHGQLFAYLVTTAIAAGTFGGVLVFAVTHPVLDARAASPVVVAEPSRSGQAGGPALVDVAADPRPASTSSPAVPIASTTPATIVSASTERAEMALLDRARAALRDGDAPGALVLLQRHKSTYPRGVYASERDDLIQRATARDAGHDGAPQ